MLQLFLTRLLSTLGVIIGVVTLVFLLIHLVPGDPVQAMLGETATATDQVALRHALGLDQPLWTQYVQTFTKLIQGNLGASLYSKELIWDMLARRIPVTFWLTLLGLGIAIVIAIPLGSLAALNKDKFWDYTAMSFSLLGISIPHFWLAPLLIMLFSLKLGWFPVSGYQGWHSLVLPAFTLGTALSAILARMVRATLLEVLHEDYIRTARAKGLNRRSVILNHALRNAALPILTVIGLQLGALLGGAVITETIFSLPGIGQLTVEAIQRRDYPVVQACVLFISITYVLVNTFTDLLYAWLDPRVHYRV
jgi:peptide/nickel transport system permease protein